MRVRFTPAARTEAREAAKWYTQQEDRALGARFSAEVVRVARLIGERPHAWTEVEPGVRRTTLRRFPFSLYYAVTSEGVLVLAVAHQSRKAGYWRNR
jgi:toxin ParE2